MPSTCSCESKRNHGYYLLENWGSGKDGFFNNWICIKKQAKLHPHAMYRSQFYMS